jgi:ABC-type dipeptide/oligopeptide/nickel transport system permease subunit
MAKNVTPKMIKINKKRLNRKGELKKNSVMRDSWKRLKRNRTAMIGLAMVVLLFILVIFSPILIPYDYAKHDYNSMVSSPSWAHLFGTDKYGRDVFSRCIYATRISLPIALCAVVVANFFGGIIGTCAAYFGGKVDNILMRIVDIWGSIPGLMFSIAIVAVLGNKMSVLILGLSIGAIPNMSRGFRAAIFTVVNDDYVESSRAIGASEIRIMIKHLIPNAVGLIIIQVVMLMGVEILCISMLSYLGVGILPPTPEWGVMLSNGKEFITGAPFLVLFPGLCIMFSVLAFNLLGDGLRDALDPRLK